MGFCFSPKNGFFLSARTNDTAGQNQTEELREVSDGRITRVGAVSPCRPMKQRRSPATCGFWTSTACRAGTVAMPRMWTAWSSDLSPAAGHGEQDVLEPFHGAEIAFARGGLLNAQERGSLGGAQLLEVPERQDLPVHGVERVKGLLEEDFPLRPHGRLAGPRILAQKLRCQGRR